MDLSPLLYDGWQSPARTAIVGALSYFLLLTILRTSGKRTIAKMNAYDLIVTVALGSTLASALTASDVAVSDSLVAFVVLAGLQYVVSLLSVYSRWAREVVSGEPTLLLLHGELLRGKLRSERVNEAEVLAAVRAHGFTSVQEVAAVVLETDGSFSVLRGGAGGEGSLRDVPDYVDP